MIRDTLNSIGLLILRVAFGVYMIIHGIPKWQGFNEMADKFPDPIGLGSKLSLISAIGTEIGCSVLLILGLGTRLSAILLAFTMIVALFKVHGNDPWDVQEKAALYLTVYVVILFTGAGKFSLDHLIWGKKHETE